MSVRTKPSAVGALMATALSSTGTGLLPVPITLHRVLLSHFATFRPRLDVHDLSNHSSSIFMAYGTNNATFLSHFLLLLSATICDPSATTPSFHFSITTFVSFFSMAISSPFHDVGDGVEHELQVRSSHGQHRLGAEQRVLLLGKDGQLSHPSREGQREHLGGLLHQRKRPHLRRQNGVRVESNPTTSTQKAGRVNKDTL